ncbi:MAG: HAD family hydrolase [Dermatophilaceae bacterium]
MDVEPVDGVIFDLHSTLLDGGDAHSWLAAAWAQLLRAGSPGEACGLGDTRAAELVAYLDRIWENTRDVDPGNRRDLDPATHRRVWEKSMAHFGLDDPDLADALYDTLIWQWTPYEDTLPLLRALRERGIRVVVLSNMGIDVDDLLERRGIAAEVDGVVLSYRIGGVKPHPAIFEKALELLAVPPERALMVGDTWQDDGGAASLGIRTLILPRTRGPIHGLGLVLRTIAR